MRALNVLAFCLAPLFVYACSHPIEIVGQGDVTSASGNRNCYLEDFQAASTKCTKNYAVGAYQETYYAQPRAGWQFDKWVNYCANAVPPNYDCAFNVSANVVARFWGQTASPLKAVFKTCTPGAVGCGWSVGEMRTAASDEWEAGIPANVLMSNYASLYNGELVVGGTYTMTFTSVASVYTYLPALGNAAALNANLTNPQSTSSGELGGQVLALKLNTDLSTAFGNDVAFGSLRVCGFTPLPAVNNTTVNQFLATANLILGGGSASFGPNSATGFANLLNNAFVNGTPSAFAQAYLIAGNCP